MQKNRLGFIEKKATEHKFKENVTEKVRVDSPYFCVYAQALNMALFTLKVNK